MIIGKCPVCGEDMRIGSDMTNADRIRSMTDEELANAWWEYVDCYECPITRECTMLGKDCKRRALAWLKEEVKE